MPRDAPDRPAAFDPATLIRTLARHRVDYVLVGALAARLQGFPRLTADADITPARDRANLERLASALRELHGRVYTDGIPEGLPFDCSAQTLARAEIWNLATSAGRVDIVFQPAGTEGYDDLKAGAVMFEVFDSHLFAAKLEDVLRSKEAADRPQDREDALVIRAMLDSRTANSPQRRKTPRGSRQR